MRGKPSTQTQPGAGGNCTARRVKAGRTPLGTHMVRQPLKPRTDAKISKAQARTCNTSITIAIKDMTAASNASHDWSQGLALHVISENVSLLAFPRQHFPLHSIAHHFIIVHHRTSTHLHRLILPLEGRASISICHSLFSFGVEGPRSYTSNQLLGNTGS